MNFIILALRQASQNEEKEPGLNSSLPSEAPSTPASVRSSQSSSPSPVPQAKRRKTASAVSECPSSTGLSDGSRELLQAFGEQQKLFMNSMTDMFSMFLNRMPQTQNVVQPPPTCTSMAQHPTLLSQLSSVSMPLQPSNNSTSTSMSHTNPDMMQVPHTTPMAQAQYPEYNAPTQLSSNSANSTPTTASQWDNFSQYHA